MKRIIIVLFFLCCFRVALCQEGDDKGIGIHIGVSHELIVFSNNGLATMGDNYKLVTFSNNGFTTIADHYTVGFPLGYKVYKINKFILDMEVVPITDFRDFTLLIHPGVLMPLDLYGLVAGARVAYELPGNLFGITPLINREFELNDKLNVFAELVLPLRYYDRTLGFSVGLHVGVAF